MHSTLVRGPPRPSSRQFSLRESTVTANNLAQMRTLMRLPGKGILPYGQIRTFWYV